MIIKVIVVVLLLLILFSLGRGLFYLVKDHGKSDRVVRSLTWRVGLSLGLFILVMLAASQGWISGIGQ